MAKKQKTRIVESMNIVDAISALTEGNFGAFTNLTTMVASDPVRNYFTLLRLDSLHIYGHRIALLCKVCGGDPVKFKRLLKVRECRLAGMSEEALQYAMDNPEMPGIDWNAVNTAFESLAFPD